MGAAELAKSPGGPMLASCPGGLTTERRSSNRDHRRVRDAGINTPEQHEGALTDTLILEDAVAPNVVALALAQLVCDRWAAEECGRYRGRGSLQVIMMKRQDR